MAIQSLLREIDESNYSDFLEEDLSVLHFFSDWEMDCLMLMPAVESIAEEFSHRACFGNVNIEECDSLAKKHEISKVPSLVILKKGKEIAKIDNCICEYELREKITCYF